MSCSSSSTMSVTGISAATAGRSQRRTSTSSRRAGCGTTTSTPRHSARRLARHLLTGRNHHAIALAAITEAATGLPRQLRFDPEKRGHHRGDAEAERLQHDGHGQVAPRPVHRIHLGRPVRPLAARHGVREVLRLPRRRNRPVGSAVVQDNHFIDTPTRPGYHLTEDLCDRAIAVHPRPAAGEHRAGRSSRTSPSARPTPRCTPRRSSSRSTRGSSTRDGTRSARRPSSGRRSSASSRRTPCCRRLTPASRRGPT